ncbi:hypothetical protein [Streptomyces sp. NPDC087856]|uniref:hypothetical protein n=1 Tax=Streptomyces sp. NPDC087856 TaxID=3365811 RepID=UPI00382711A7
MLEDTDAYREWQFVRLAAALPGDQRQAEGADFLRAAVDRGLLFDPEGPDPAEYLDGYGLWGQAAPLHQFWPRLAELTAGHDVLPERLSGLEARVLITQVPVNGFAAGVTGFADGSHLMQFDTGLFATVLLGAQLLTKVSLCDPAVSEPDNQGEAAGLLEVLLAEYRLLNGDVAPKVLLQAPHHAQVAGELAHAAEVFALTHEVAHVLLGHTGSKRHHPRSRDDEITADVLALQILSGVHAAGPPPTREQQRGRLLGIRLMISCLELYEDAVFVRCGRTHPAAADRWTVIRLAASQLYHPRILAEVDELWFPLSTLIRRLSVSASPLEDVRAALERIKARNGFTTGFDWQQAVSLVAFYRRTNATVTDPDAVTEGRRLADAARTTYPPPKSITWSQVLALRIKASGAIRPEVLNATAVGAVAIAAHFLREHPD